MAPSNAKTPGRIFISYRRNETDFPASWLYERLAAHFGPDQVFKDVDSIELGDDFAEVIADAVGTCDVLLVLIGSQWLAITDDAGRRRLENSYDFVRIEIEAALQRNVRIIPILIGRTTMPEAHELPASLGKLARRQALALDPNRFEVDTRRLVRVVEKTLAEEEAKRQSAAQQAAEESRLTTVETLAASLRADGQAEVDAAEAALCRLAGDESERVARAAQAALRVWAAEQGRSPGEAEQHTGGDGEDPVLPPAKFVASVPPVDATEAGSTTVPIKIATAAPSAGISAGSGRTRRRLLVAGGALAVVLAGSGVAYAVYDNGEDPVGAAVLTSPSTRPTATPSATVPADEQCTEEIKSNPRWVCLASAVVANGKITIKYEVDYDGSIPNVKTGYHVHIFGSDGKQPPDYSMSSHYPANHARYYWEDREPSVLDTDSSRYRDAIGDFPKVCARIAITGHGLVPDLKGGYHTGNCVRITRPKT
jgi:hypothetical protein